MEMEENIIENKYCNYSKKDGKINARKNNNYFTIHYNIITTWEWIKDLI